MLVILGYIHTEVDEQTKRGVSAEREGGKVCEGSGDDKEVGGREGGTEKGDGKRDEETERKRDRERGSEGAREGIEEEMRKLGDWHMCVALVAMVRRMHE